MDHKTVTVVRTNKLIRTTYKTNNENDMIMDRHGIDNQVNVLRETNVNIIERITNIMISYCLV